jgi:hypothetical protein
MKAKGFDQGDKVLAKTPGLWLIHALCKDKLRGLVTTKGKHKAAYIWELPPQKNAGLSRRLWFLNSSVSATA